MVKEHQVAVHDVPGRRSSAMHSSDDDIRGLVYCISITVESHLRTSPADALNSRKSDKSSVRDVTAQHGNIVSKDERRDRGMRRTRPSFVHPTDLELDDREDPPEDPRERVTGYRADIGKMVSSQEQRVSYMTSRCKSSKEHSIRQRNGRAPSMPLRPHKSNAQQHTEGVGWARSTFLGAFLPISRWPSNREVLA